MHIGATCQRGKGVSVQILRVVELIRRSPESWAGQLDSRIRYLILPGFVKHFLSYAYIMLHNNPVQRKIPIGLENV